MLRRFVIAAAIAASLAACATREPTVAQSGYDKPGFVTEVANGRLWVFAEGSEAYQEFQQHGELKEVVTRIGAGPEGMTVKAADGATIDAYLAAN